ncbi:hypothetical protein AVEN_183743-1 [Araneus ventricosus]|uniref:Uncharacterized protein n=1 Tax=Araneus ventricosus TaxID=182803 RepID=A0A4Y2PRY4_ARAVE|nr:hypothetical protein AVEN_183743-1 [Araneus ventricosus]
MKLRNHPTVGTDHWGYRSLVVRRPGVQFSSGVKGRRRSTPRERGKNGVLGWNEESGERTDLGSLEGGFRLRSAEKICVISFDLKSRIENQLLRISIIPKSRLIEFRALILVSYLG